MQAEYIAKIATGGLEWYNGQVGWDETRAFTQGHGEAVRRPSEMGQNKELRKKIASLHDVVRNHEVKIRTERARPQPGEGVIIPWQREITAARKKIDSYTRRLKKEW